MLVPQLAAAESVIFGPEMRTMPGLPSKPVYMQIDLDDHGRVIGLS